MLDIILIGLYAVPGGSRLGGFGGTLLFLFLLYS